MYWLFLLFAIGAFFFALTTTHAGLLWLALLAALACLLLWVRGLYHARTGGAFTATPRALHPAELQAMREQLRPAAPPPSNLPPEGQPQP
ncbi:conserved exported hypothetical protein [uncultured Stenotrophomonas sp.]|uniref:Transmembrane protein n=1 Tax=uncultured Stenotrophomonas sp. TaxID=165438 RepID=A0A1Y5Q8K3_9GAMM|nr:conserved exported hypothetical protein [uncultured Stenotrophomonas sp.]